MTSLARILPSAAVRPCGRVAGRLAHLLSRRRHRLHRQLRRAHPELAARDALRLAQRALEHATVVRWDAVASTRLSAVKLCRRLHLGGWAAFHAIEGSTIVLGPRIGCWETALVAVGLYRGPLDLLLSPADAEELVARLTRFGNRRLAGGDAEQVLRDGGRVGLAIDSLAATGEVARLALASGAPVVPVFCWPDARNGYLLEVRQAIDPRTQADEAGIAAACRGVLASEIRQRPEVWAGWEAVD